MRARLILVLALGLIALYGGEGAGRLTLRPIYDAHAFSLSTVAGAASIAVLSFLGFDGISVRGQRSHEQAARRGFPLLRCVRIAHK